MVATAAESYRKIDDILDRMDTRLEELVATGDRRQIFLTVYRSMTQQMREALPGSRFLDAEWTLALTVRFADMYFEADEVFCGPEPDTCPPPWERAFTMAAEPTLLVIEHALLGINAHITYDLPRAVAQTMREFGDTKLTPDGIPNAGVLARRRYDYEVVNEILATTTDSVQDVLGRRFSPLLRLLDAVALRADEAAAEMFLRYTRTQGWNHAVAMAFAQSEEETELIRQHLADVALGIAQRIDIVTHLPGPIRWGLGPVRRPIVSAAARAATAARKVGVARGGPVRTPGLVRKRSA